MRKLKLLKNTISSFIFQITAIICGFILPRLILDTYGSATNGLVNSITQFLQIISFLELGVGAVVQSSLYKPLAEKDNIMISKIFVSASKFFKTIAKILIVYIIILIIIYPSIINDNYNFLYTDLLIVSIAIGLLSQYYFGIVDKLLLMADQKGYIFYNIQTITLIFNTIISVILIKLDQSIQLVKLVSSLIYIFRPLYLRWYVTNYYLIDKKIEYREEPIKQKWNGVAQHISYVVLDSTDNIVLSIFSTLKSVSVYSVYNLIFSGVKQLLMATTSGIQSLLGELWAKQELDELTKSFGWFEWGLHTVVVFVFGCTGMLIVPFVKVYTNGITDANYLQPLFASLMVTAHAIHCLRLPYNIMILAGGHYKQTQKCYIIAAIINIFLSIFMVKIYGLIGVAIGTLVAMLYQTAWMILYDSKNLLCWSTKKVMKQFLIDFFEAFLGVLICKSFILANDSYFSWLILALKIAFVWLFIIVIFNLFFYRKKMINLIKKLRR